MSDQCKTCELRGEFVKCYANDCFKHRDWFQRELMERYERAMERSQADRLAVEKAREALADGLTLEGLAAARVAMETALAALSPQAGAAALKEVAE